MSNPTKKFLRFSLESLSKRFHFSFINVSYIFKARTLVLLDWVLFKINSQYWKDVSSFWN